MQHKKMFQRLTLMLLVTMVLALGAPLAPAAHAVDSPPAGCTVVGWGSDEYGMVTPPEGLTDVVAIAAGPGHALALKSDGTVVGWGGDPYGTGAGTPPEGLTDVVAIAAGTYHSLALKSDGTVVGWGFPDIVDPETLAGLSEVTAIAAGEFHSLALKVDGTVVGLGLNDNGQATPPEGLSNVVAIAAGSAHSLALKSDGTVVGWGTDWQGVAIPPEGLTDVVAIAAGSYHSLALKSDGTVVGWGYTYGNGGETPPEGLNNVTAIAAGGDTSLALKADGTVVGWGRDDFGQATPPEGLADVTAIAAGGLTSLALTPPCTSATDPATARINGSDCSLNDAIVAANTDTATGMCAAGSPGADTIELLSDVLLTNGLAAISSAITIEGGGHTIARDAGAAGFGILTVAGAGNLTLNATTVTGGSASYGGGILNLGTLTLNGATVSGNTAGIYGGGGIYNGGTSALNGATVSGNTTSGSGGGIENFGTLTLENSTVSDNDSADTGGGIFSAEEIGYLTVSNSTITGNTTRYDGGGIWSGGDVSIARSLIAGNVATEGASHEFVSYGTSSSGGHNLFGHDGASGTYWFAYASSDFVASQPLSAILSPLAANGGPALTHALPTGSPAIDAAADGPAADQRGVSRPQGCGFDIGAFELEQPACVVNASPVITVDNASVTVDEGQVIVNSGTVSDPDGDTVTLYAPAGTVTNNGDGTWSWSYPGGLDGPMSGPLDIVAADGQGHTAQVTFTIIVNNVPPTANAGEDQTVFRNDIVTVSGTWTDPMGAVDGPYQWGWDLNGDGEFDDFGSANYGDTIARTTSFDLDGVVTLTFGAQDKHVDFTVDTVQITVVNRAPTANEQALSTNAGTALPITLSGADADSDALVFSVVDQPTHGTLSGTAPDLTYTPAAGYSGPDSFTFKANDGIADSNLATVSITVNPPANAAPVIATTNASVTVDEGQPASMGGTVSDPDGDAVALSASTGTVTGNGSGAWSWSAPTTDGPANATVTITADDGKGGVSQASFAVTVNNVAPVVNAGADQTVFRNATVTLSGTWTDPAGAADSPYSWTWDLNGDGLPDDSGSANAGDTIARTTSFAVDGVATLTFDVTDQDGAKSSDTVQITVVNRAPTANDQAVSTAEDAALAITLTGSDQDNDTLVYSEMSAPAHGTLSGTAPNFTYTPDADYFGPDSFTFKANDGLADSTLATVSITVNSVNDPVLAVDDTVTTDEDTAVSIAVLANDSAGPANENQALSTSAVADPPHGTAIINPDGSLAYTPDPDYNGPDSFGYTACDADGACADAAVTVLVAMVNDPPVAVDDSATTNEETPVTINVVSNDSDVDGNLNAASAAVVAEPANGTVANLANGSFTYTPAAGFNGADSFMYEVCDGDGICASATVNITVVAVNDAPVCSSLVPSVAVLWPPNHQLEPVTVSGATDSDGDALTYSVTAIKQDEKTNGLGDGDTSPDGQGIGSGTAQVRVERAGNGDGRYYHITFAASDGQGGSCSGTVKVSIPKSQGKNGAAVDGGPLYDSTLP